MSHHSTDTSSLQRLHKEIVDDMCASESRRHAKYLALFRELMSLESIDVKLEKALIHIVGGLDNPDLASVAVEVDSKIFGPSIDESEALHSSDIQVEGLLRGRISLTYADAYQLSPSEREFIDNVAEFISLAVVQSDGIKALQTAKKRSDRRSTILERQMRDRTKDLASKTSYLEGILRSSDDVIITTDLDARIVEFNAGAEKILGYYADEVVGHNVGILWENAYEREKILKEVHATGGVRNFETRLKTANGEIREMSLTLSLLKDEEGGVLGTVGISKDITDQKEMIRQLEQLNRNFRETVHFVSHEYKNSLMVIGGFVRRLIESESDPNRKEQLQIVYHHSKFLEAMSLDFLVMAELEHGEFQIRPRFIENFHEEVIRPAMMGLKERYPDSFESYDVSEGGVGDVQVLADPNMLEIVFRNLFGNALKYRSPGGKISYGVQIYPDRYVFNVWNEGPGVEETHREMIFEKFYRVSDESTREKRGTGLGLYNIRGIIEAHGGRIWCETEPGRWINFLFEIPRNKQ